MNETKLVYKCFQVARNCETCKFIQCDDLMINEVTTTGTCEISSKRVNLKDDCASWDFDEELLDDAFWILKPNITGEIK